MNPNNKNIVFPGDKLAEEEELLLGNGTYLDSNHSIRSAIFGEKYVDKMKYKLNMFYKSKKPVTPKNGDFVLGEIGRVSKFSILLKIYYINDTAIFPPYSAIMHVSSASEIFTENATELYAASDIIRAKIIDSHTLPLQLETKDRDTGVIYSFCEICGGRTGKTKKNTLVCEECGHSQTRKTSIEYGKYLPNINP